MKTDKVIAMKHRILELETLNRRLTEELESLCRQLTIHLGVPIPKRVQKLIDEARGL